jgi:protein gp37
VGDRSSIEWCDATWNPVTGCTRVSEGCRNCYAEREAIRHQRHAAYEGTARSTAAGPRWTGQVNFIPERLDQPLRWQRGRRVFVNSMSDLFHEGLTDGQILRVFQAMAVAPQHTYLVLTKRPQRMLEWLRRWNDLEGEPPGPQMVRGPEATRAAHPSGRGQMFASMLESMGAPPDGCAYPTFDWMQGMRGWPEARWTWPNVWMGVSAEDQPTADERIPLLLQCPAAIHWVSAEPLLGPIDLSPYMCPSGVLHVDDIGVDVGTRPIVNVNGVEGHQPWMPALSWVVVGGESGPGARPFDLAWARSTVEQCRAAGVPCFVKQLGARPHWPQGPEEFEIDWLSLLDRKGGDWSEWPEDLRVREYPEVRT